MENKSIVDVRPFSKRFLSVESTIEGPLEASNGKQYYKAKFEMNSTEDDGYSGQSRAYTKCFFADSHSLFFLKAQKALEDETPLKMKGARIAMPTEKKFYILDEKGERIKNADGSYRMGQTIVGFFLEDENPQNYFNQQKKSISNNHAWVEEEVADEDLEIEEEVTKETKKTKK